MSKSEHTPGPWDLGQTGCYETALVERHSGRMVAYAAWDGGSCCHLEIENDADARLIGAAPDLLEVAKTALATIDSTLRDRGYREGECTDDWVPAVRMEVATRAKLRAVIAKATGGEA